MMKRNILIVEDDKSSMETLASITRQCNHTSVVFCAGTKEKAYTYAVEEQIDVL